MSHILALKWLKTKLVVLGVVPRINFAMVKEVVPI